MNRPHPDEHLLRLVRALRTGDRPTARESAEAAVGEGISSALVDAMLELADVTQPGRPLDEPDRRLAVLLDLPMVGEIEGRAVPLTPAAERIVGVGFTGDLGAGLEELTGAGRAELEALLAAAYETGRAARTVSTDRGAWRLAATFDGESTRVSAAPAQRSGGREQEQLATLNHELTNGLTALASLAAMARHPSSDPSYVRDALLKIEQTAIATVRSAKGTRRALESAPPSLPPRALELSPILIDLVESFEALARARSVVLERRIAADLRTFARDTDLRSIVWNLLKNAIEAGGRRVRVGGSEHGERIRVIIDDDGPGMSLAVQKRAFEPYYTTKEGGTGLGLPLVKHLVDRLGGTLLVESEPGRGTRMVVSLLRTDEDVAVVSGVRARPHLGLGVVLLGPRANGLDEDLRRAGADVVELRDVLERGHRVGVAVVDATSVTGTQSAVVSETLREAAQHTLWLGAPGVEVPVTDPRLPPSAPLERVLETLRDLRDQGFAASEPRPHRARRTTSR